MTSPHDDTTRGRIIVAVLFFAMGGTIGAAQYSFGLFVPPLEAEFGWSRTQISASLSFVAVGSLAGPLLGRLMDRVGARPVLVASLMLSASSYLLRPLMTELWHWYALSFVQFIAFSGATVLPTARLIGIWFGDRRGRMMGIAAAGPNFGGLILPIMVASLLSVSSWHLAYVGLGVFLAVVGLVSIFTIQEEPSRLASRRTGQAAAAGAAHLGGVSVRDAVRSRSFMLITLATVAAFFTYGTILPHVVSHFTNEGMSPQRASFLLGALAIAGMAGKLVFGYLSERITARRAFVVDLAAQAVAVLLMAVVDVATLVWVAPVYGFFLGGTGVLAPLIVQEFYGLKNFGAISGLSNMATVISFGVGPLIAGLSFDMTASYDLAFYIAAVIFMVGAGLVALVRPDEINGAGVGA